MGASYSRQTTDLSEHVRDRVFGTKACQSQDDLEVRRKPNLKKNWPHRTDCVLKNLVINWSWISNLLVLRARGKTVRDTWSLLCGFIATENALVYFSDSIVEWVISIWLSHGASHC